MEYMEFFEYYQFISAEKLAALCCSHCLVFAFLRLVWSPKGAPQSFWLDERLSAFCHKSQQYQNSLNPVIDENNKVTFFPQKTWLSWPIRAKIQERGIKENIYVKGASASIDGAGIIIILLCSSLYWIANKAFQSLQMKCHQSSKLKSSEAEVGVGGSGFTLQCKDCSSHQIINKMCNNRRRTLHSLCYKTAK